MCSVCFRPGSPCELHCKRLLESEPRSEQFRIRPETVSHGMWSKWDKNFPLTSSSGWLQSREGYIEGDKICCRKKMKIPFFLKLFVFYWKGSLLLLRTTVRTFCFWCGKVSFEQAERESVKSLSCVWLFVTPWTTARQAPLWNSPGKNTEVGSHSLLQGIFPTEGSNPGLLHCRQILYHLSPNPRTNRLVHK